MGVVPLAFVFPVFCGGFKEPPPNPPYQPLGWSYGIFKYVYTLHEWFAIFCCTLHFPHFRHNMLTSHAICCTYVLGFTTIDWIHFASNICQFHIAHVSHVWAICGYDPLAEQLAFAKHSH